MRSYLIKIIASMFAFYGLTNDLIAQSCASCQANDSGNGPGVSFHFSMGFAHYGESAGSLAFNSLLPDVSLYTPSALQYTASSRADVAVITNSSGIRQVLAPQALADVIVVVTNVSYQINYYRPSQVGSLSGGVYAVTGSPYMTWTVTNSDPSNINNIQVTKSSLSDGLLAAWMCVYSTNSGLWSIASLGGVVQANNSILVLSNGTSQIVASLQSSNGPAVRQTIRTYETFNWGAASTQVTLGSNASQVISYTYYDPCPYASYSATAPIKSIQNSDGSWQFFFYTNSLDVPIGIVSSFGDVPITSLGAGRITTNDYTTNFISGSGDNGTVGADIPRRVVTYVGATEISRGYTIFPSAYIRIDIKCATAGAVWNASDNLYTTNCYYTNGDNQYLLKSVVLPDKTMTTYDYRTNSDGTYRTNITATGVPDPTFTYIVDGTTNYAVVNQFGQSVLNYSADIMTAIVLQQDTYADFDGYGRPQRIAHLDGTTEYMTYSCCGLATTTDRDGIVTTILYDTAKRQVGYTRNGITYSNVIDAAGQVLQRIRIGTDGSTNILEQSQYDLAGELISRTNALNWPETFLRTNDATTGGLIRVTTKPDGGVISNLYYLDGSLKEVYGTGARPTKYLLGVDGTGLYTGKVCLTASNGTNEWVKNSTDMLGRHYRTTYADASSPPYLALHYNLFGQLTNEIDPDGVSKIYVYNAKGDRIYSIIDSNQDGNIGWNGSDRVTFTTNDIVTDSGINVRRTQTYAFTTGGSYSSNLISTVEYSVDGLMTLSTFWNLGGPVTTKTVTVYDGSGYRYVTNIAPDNSYTVSTYLYGQLTSVTRNFPSGGQLSQTSYAYDAHGRQYTSTDARNGTTTYYFNNADKISGVKTPSPDGVLSGQVTTNYFDKMGRITNSVLTDGTSVTSEFYLTGDLNRTYGSTTYPVGYGYDVQGRMTKMTNWTSFAAGAGARVTSWSYDAYRGFLSSKTYDGGASGPSYIYTAAGRLNQRTWARGVRTTYGYDGAGGLSTVIYSDGTPGVTNGYDRRGRLTIVSNGPTVCGMTYNDQNQLLTEAYTGGPLNGITVASLHDGLLRRTNNTVSYGTTNLVIATNNYDAASRLNFISNGTNSATYSYLANSPLVSQITFAQSGTTRMTTAKQYDLLNRLTLIYSSNATAGLLDSHGYAYNTANQRTAATNTDSSQWNYQYDSLGQIISGKKYWSDATPVAGEQFGYAFDDIGNRKTTSAGGDQWGANLRWANYSVNNLNQYINRTVPGAMDIIGSATNAATVTVNNEASYRKGSFYRAQLPLNNSASAVWQSVTNFAVLNQTGASDLTTSNVGNVFLPQTPESFTYDADGNLTQDGRWNYYWDAENRLTNMTSLSSAPSGSKLKLDFAYDYRGRRVQKLVWTNNGVWVPEYTNYFAYDGWNLVSVLNPAFTAIQSFMWGSDIRGSTKAAEGVGALLSFTSSTTNCSVAYDGNGNVSGLTDLGGGTLLAHYEYGPFGELVRASGPMAKSNPIRFSTKYHDDESELIYYGYRFYNTVAGRWPNRDLIGESGFELKRNDPANIASGGANLYEFVRNNPENQYDKLGLDADVTWDPAFSRCKKGQVIVFIQVAYGGMYRTPIVDDGSHALIGANATHCPEYPNFGVANMFQDSPSGALTARTYITALACAQPCCGPTRPNEFTRRIVSIVTIVKWHLGDTGPINDGALRLPFQFADLDDGATFFDALNRDYPNYKSCYTCYHKPKY